MSTIYQCRLVCVLLSRVKVVGCVAARSTYSVWLSFVGCRYWKWEDGGVLSAKPVGGIEDLVGKGGC